MKKYNHEILIVWKWLDELMSFGTSRFIHILMCYFTSSISCQCVCEPNLKNIRTSGSFQNAAEPASQFDINMTSYQYRKFHWRNNNDRLIPSMLFHMVRRYMYIYIHKHISNRSPDRMHIVYPTKYAHGFVVLCFVVVMQSFIMNSHEVFIHIHQGCFAGTGAIVRLPQCQWSKPEGYGKISQRITTTKHSKAKTVCIFLGKYCIYGLYCCIV